MLLEWNDALAIDGGTMDTVHQEFVDLLNQLYVADDASIASLLENFIAHTKAHFEQEQDWMGQCSFPPVHCHTRQHEEVLRVAREVQERVAAGEHALGKALAVAVADWFRDHAASMDTMLAHFLRETGHGALLAPKTASSPRLRREPAAA